MLQRSYIEITPHQFSINIEVELATGPTIPTGFRSLKKPDGTLIKKPDGTPIYTPLS